MPGRRGEQGSVRRRVRGLVAATAAGLLLAGCEGGVLDPQGPVGRAERTILFNALAIMLAIVVPTILAALAFAWWFRAGNARARFRPGFVYSGRIELIVWSIPTLVILFLGGVIWIGSHQLDPAAPLPGGREPLEVQVVSLDWKWLFLYPGEDVAAVNELVIPAGRPVHFSLTSASVMTAFFVPQLGSMIYTMNGMRTQLNLQADQAGSYFGQAAHFSGDGFPGMTFTVEAVPDDAFDSWVGAAKAKGPMLDRAAYEALARPSSDVPPTTFRQVEPGLFDAIVTQHVPPAPGPAAGRGGATRSPRTGG